MIPAPFAYRRVDTVAEAAALLDEHGDEAKVLAGGQSLLPLMKLHFAAPAMLIDLGRVGPLRHIAVNGALRVGAMVTHAQMGRSAPLTERIRAIADAAADIADPLIRNRGTFGGSLAHADPAGDWPAVALALDARIRATSSAGEREIPVDEFFTDMYTTALAVNEILTEVELPDPGPESHSAYVKIPHPASGYALAGAAVAVTLDPAGVCRSARIALTGVATVPFRAIEAETILAGQVPTTELIAAAAAAVANGIEPVADSYAPSAYRKHLASVVTGRAIRRALQASVPAS